MIAYTNKKSYYYSYFAFFRSVTNYPGIQFIFSYIIRFLSSTSIVTFFGVSLIKTAFSKMPIHYLKRWCSIHVANHGVEATTEVIGEDTAEVILSHGNKARGRKQQQHQGLDRQSYADDSSRETTTTRAFATVRFVAGIKKNRVCVHIGTHHGNIIKNDLNVYKYLICIHNFHFLIKNGFEMFDIQYIPN